MRKSRFTEERIIGVLKVKPRFIDPGRPVQNAYIESFNGKFRDERLNQHWFLGVEDAREKIELRRVDYNRARPHTSLGGAAQEKFAKAAARRKP